jgi:DNA-binding XRE family transcriptional regulator
VTESPLAGALLARPNLDSPVEIWELVQGALASDWQPFDRSEAARFLAEANDLIVDKLTDGQPTNWQWNLGASLALLHRIADGASILLIEALFMIRLNVIAHRWHIDQTGRDRLSDVRWRFVEYLGRLVMDTEPRAWERQLLSRPIGEALYARPAERLRRRREAAGLTQGELATRIGASRSTVARWESGTRRPTARHAQALVGELGGAQADYVSP